MKKRKIFYKLYSVYILLFCIVMTVVLYKLYIWLTDYEASQPTHKADEVFSEMFENPDWGALYDRVGIKDSVYEGREAYIAYMTEKVGETPLKLIKTSAGLSGDKKYFVKLKEENLLSFTLVSSEPSERGITTWSLGDIELFYEHEEGVRVQLQTGHTVMLNGIPLDEECVIQRLETVAEEYLPVGVHGKRQQVLVEDGLLVEPEITIVDEVGKEQKVIYDVQTDTYIEQVEEFKIGEDERDAVLRAAQEYSKHMLGIKVKLSEYFNTDSEIYKVIRKNENWMSGYSNYEFSEAEFTNYYPYTDDLFSVRVSMVLSVFRKNGSTKEYTVDSEFFMERQEDGKWLVTDITNVYIQQEIVEVLLTYRDDENILKREFVRTDSERLEMPLVDIPKDMVFSGWAKEEIGEKGERTRVLLFVPDEKGIVVLPKGYELQPLILYALLEKGER